MSQKSLYERLGSYDGIATFVDELLPRLVRSLTIGSFLAKSGRRWYCERKATTDWLFVLKFWRPDILYGPRYEDIPTFMLNTRSIMQCFPYPKVMWLKSICQLTPRWI